MDGEGRGKDEEVVRASGGVSWSMAMSPQPCEDDRCSVVFEWT